VCITAMINRNKNYRISFSVVQRYDLSHNIHLHLSPSTGMLQNHKVTSFLMVW